MNTKKFKTALNTKAARIAKAIANLDKISLIAVDSLDGGSGVFSALNIFFSRTASDISLRVYIFFGMVRIL